MDTRKIILYPKYFTFAEYMTDEQFGKVIRAIGSFFIDGNTMAGDKFSKDESLLFKMIQFEINENWRKYEEICEKRRIAGIKSGESRKGKEQVLTCVGNNINNNINNNNNSNMNNNNNNNSNKNNNNDDKCIIIPSPSPEDAEQMWKKLELIHRSAME